MNDSADDSDQFQYSYRYPPYHNVERKTTYPAVLFLTGDADTRIDLLHARKMTALLQVRTGSSRSIMLSYDTKAGHSSGRTYDKIVGDLVDKFSFLFWQPRMSAR